MKDYRIVKYWLILFVLSAGLVCASEDVTVLTYQEVCRRAVERATGLKLAGKGVTDARIMTKSAYTNLWPKINGSFNYTRFKDEIAFEIEGMQAVIQPGSTSSMKLNADMPLIQIRVPVLIRAANFNLIGEQEKLRKALGDLLFNVSELYLMILAAEDSVSIFKESVENLRQHRDLSKARYEVGEVPETAYLQAEYELGKAELNLLESQTTRDDLKESLRILIHWKGDFNAVTPDFPDDPGKSGSFEFSELLEKAEKMRPDLFEARAQMMTARALKKATLAEFAPTMSAFFEWDHNFNTSAFSPEDQTWLAGLSVNWAIFERGSRFTTIKKYENQYETAELNLQLLMEQARRSIFLVLNDIETTGKSLLVNNKQIEFAKRNFELVTEQYKVGLATSMNVLEANTFLISAKMSATIDSHNLTRLYLNLLNETGELLSFLSINNDVLISIVGGPEKDWKKWPKEKQSKSTQ
ncbi:MAG: TolC family protein [Candidatus Theseobacter exili]|nr:TolC family protein [Candidatus Theseobacter exili]